MKDRMYDNPVDGSSRDEAGVHRSSSNYIS